jgi:hypothetical protein
MAEEDWFPSILRDSARVRACFWLFAGTIAIVLALVGYPWTKTWIVGESKPRYVWLDHPNWQLLALGTAIVAWNMIRLWLRKRHDKSARPASRPGA